MEWCFEFETVFDWQHCCTYDSVEECGRVEWLVGRTEACECEEGSNKLEGMDRSVDRGFLKECKCHE